jgi:hypothetical protein
MDDKMSQEIELQDIIEDLSSLDIIILSLLHARNNEPVKGNLFFQKEMFVITDYIEEIKDPADYQPYLHGAWSEACKVHLKNLKSLSLVESNDNIRLSHNGEKVISSIKSPLLSKDNIDAIEDFKEFLNSLTRQELLLFSYVSYPKFAEESTTYKDVMSRRVPTAISLYKKRKISLGKAVFLSGLNIDEFLDRL